MENPDVGQKNGKGSGPRIVTNIRQATPQQIITRHNFYMYEFRTKYCEDFPNFMCKKAKPYVCTRAHYENNIRRRPRLVQGKFNFTDKLCTHASLADCPKGMNCCFSHRIQKEHIYHPSVYKTHMCESALCEDGVCAEFGVHCAKAHGPKDLRQPQYEPDDPRAQQQLEQTSGNSSPNSSSSLSSQDSKLRADAPCFKMPKTMDETTKEVKNHSDYMYRFRVETCALHSKGKCPVDACTCFYHHKGKNASRRVPKLVNGKFNYLPIRCRDMLKTKTCQNRENCRFAHSKEEVIYHPSKYKTQLCPHPLKKVLVIKQAGNVASETTETSKVGVEKKTCEMWVCAGYGMHCARAHGQSDLRLPVFENCSKKAPAAKPLHPNTPCRDVSSSIFTRTGLTHGGSRQRDPVYRSMPMNDSAFAAGRKSEHKSSWTNLSSLRPERAPPGSWMANRPSIPLGGSTMFDESKGGTSWSNHRLVSPPPQFFRMRPEMEIDAKQHPPMTKDSFGEDSQPATGCVSGTRVDSSKGLAKYLPSFLVNFVTNNE